MEHVKFLIYYLLPTFKVKYRIAKALVKDTPDKRKEIVEWLIQRLELRR